MVLFTSLKDHWDCVESRLGWMASLGDGSVTEVVATVVQAGLLVLRQGGVGGSSGGVSCLCCRWSQEDPHSGVKVEGETKQRSGMTPHVWFLLLVELEFSKEIRSLV